MNFFFFRWLARSDRKAGSNRPRQARLALEHLEDRLVPSATDLIGTTTYLTQYPAGSQPTPQMLAVTSENLATGTFTGTWADGLNNKMIPVTGQVNLLYAGSNGVNLNTITLHGSTSGELMSFSGYIECSVSGMEMLGQFTDLHNTPSDGVAGNQLELAGFNRSGPIPSPETLGQQAMQWAVENYGQSVYESWDTAQTDTCTDLVDRALRAVGANGIVYYNGPSVPANGNYVWGNLAARFNPNTTSPASYNVIQPGEVLQFHDVGIPGVPGVAPYQYAYQQHTSIVVDNQGNGVLDVVDQNVNENHNVSIETINLAQMTAGASDAEISVYQPVA